MKADKVRDQPSSQGDEENADSGTDQGGENASGPTPEQAGGEQGETPPEGNTDQGGSSGAPDLSDSGLTQGVPEDWPDDVPVPDGASDVLGATGSALPLPGADGKAIVVTLDGSPEEVAKRYADSLASQGWVDSPLLAMYGATPEASGGSIIKSKGDRTILAMPSPVEGGKTQLMIMVVTGDFMSMMQQGLDHPPTS